MGSRYHSDVMVEPNDDVLLVFTHLPDESSACKLAQALLTARVAACVNQMAPTVSRYWWQGEIAEATEWPLLIKSTRACYVQLERVIRQVHPYDLPEIIAVPVIQGLAPYLDWVKREVTEVPHA